MLDTNVVSTPNVLKLNGYPIICSCNQKWL